MRAGHAHVRFGEQRPQQIFDGVFVGRERVGAFQDDYIRRPRMLQKQIDRRRLALAPSLHQHGDLRVTRRLRLGNRDSLIGTAARHHDNFLQPARRDLLAQKGLEQFPDVGFFIIGHDSDAATSFHRFGIGELSKDVKKIILCDFT